MVTDQDVIKLREIFATKEDLSLLESSLIATFVSKEEFSRLSEKVDGIQEELGDLKVEVAEVRERMDSGFDSLESKFDGMLGLLMASMEEHAVGAVQYARHDRQISALAAATGISLPE